MDDPVLRWRGAHPDPVESIGQVPVVASAVWSVGEPAHPDCQLGEQMGRSASPEADIAGRTLKGILHLAVQVSLSRALRASEYSSNLAGSLLIVTHDERNHMVKNWPRCSW